MLWDYVQARVDDVRGLVARGLAFVIKDAVEVCVLAALYNDTSFRGLVRDALMLDLDEDLDCEHCADRDSCERAAQSRAAVRPN